MGRMCCLAYLAIHACAAWGDGAFMEPVMTDRISGTTGIASTEQKGVVIELPEGREALLLQTTYNGPAHNFAWVVPVPGRPGRGDVFLASPAFIDELLQNTRPEVQTDITDPRATRTLKGDWEEEEEGGGGEAAVIVYERMKVGDFDVAVLSATGPEVLTNWLTENGYRIPDGSDPIFDHYVAKQWYFVALRIQPGKVEERPVLQDVDPIGIRFDTDELVYPLYISRASSRQKTAMLLLVLSNAPVACDQLPEARLPTGEWLEKGTCYATVRREAVERESPSAVCEFRGSGTPYLPGHYESDRFTSLGSGWWSLGDLWMTRLWTILDREDMADLTFSDSDDRQAMKLAVIRQGRVYSPPPSFAQRISASIRSPRHWRWSATGGFTWLYGAAGVLFFICTLWAAERGFRLKPGYVGSLAVFGVFVAAAIFGAVPLVQMSLVTAACALGLSVIVGGYGGIDRSQRLSADNVAKGALVAAGLGIFGRIAYCTVVWGPDFLRQSPDVEHLVAYCAGAWPVHYLVPAALLHIIWIVLAVDFVCRGLAGMGRMRAWVAVPLLCFLAIILIELKSGYLLAGVADVFTFHYGSASEPPGALPPVLTAISLVSLGALCLLLAFIAAAWRIGDPARRTAAPIARVLIGLVLVAVLFSVLGMASVRAGEGGYLPSGLNELDAALIKLDFMLTNFRHKYGCYPLALADLTRAEAPAEGRDSSGNRVDVTIGVPPEVVIAPGVHFPERVDGPLNELPVDPLTGRRDTWLYEPTGSPMIDSGGYQIRIVERPIGPG